MDGDMVAVIPPPSKTLWAAAAIWSRSDGLVAGTYLHGLFENGAFRRAILLALARRKAVELPASAGIQSLDEAFDALADAVARDLDMDAVGRIVGRPLAAVR